MKTGFTSEQLQDPIVARAEPLLRDCVHYGFCIPVCPTFVLLGDEKDSPRGRIDLIREMLERGGTPDAATVRHLDRCLSCLSCANTCAARVDFGHLMDAARAYIERNFTRPLPERWLRTLLSRALTSPKLFAALWRLGRLARPVASCLPGRLGGMVRMLPDRLDDAQAVSTGVYPAEGPRRVRVGIHTGCVQQVMGSRITAAAVRLLTRHGCEVTVRTEAGCCGALDLHMGREDAALEKAANVVRTWADLLHPGELDALVITTSGCGTVLKDYGRLFAEHHELAEPARRLGSIARDVTQVLSGLKLRSSTNMPPLKVAYHDACSLQHGQRVTAQPRNLLRAAGFDVRDIPERHFCCGSAGTYNMLQPELGEALGRRKAQNIESTGAAVVAAGNLGCIVQISRFTDLPVMHTVELLDWATGGPRPGRLPDIETAVTDAQAAAPATEPSSFW